MNSLKKHLQDAHELEFVKEELWNWFLKSNLIPRKGITGFEIDGHQFYLCREINSKTKEFCVWLYTHRNQSER